VRHVADRDALARTYTPAVSRLRLLPKGLMARGQTSESGVSTAMPAMVVLVALTLSASGRASESLNPSVLRLAVVLVWPLAVYLLALTGRTWIAAAYCVAAGAVLRWNNFWPGGSSDVIKAVDEALRTLFSGGNPYDHYYVSTSPPGSNMPYPPGQLLLHLPGWLLGGYDGARLTELAAAIVGMAVLAWLALRFAPAVGLVGLALYAGLPNLIQLTGDGSNDTSAGVMVLVAVAVMVAAARRSMTGRWAGAAGIAVALMMATKQSTLLFAIALSLYVLFVHRTALAQYLAGMFATLLIVSVPFLLMGPATYIHGVAAIESHGNTYGWNVWILLNQLGWPTPDSLVVTVVNLFVTIDVLVAVAVLCRRGVGAAVLAGALATLAALLTAQWTSPSYFALVLAPLAAIPALMTWDDGAVA
jgi:hypothetical protein